MAKNLSQYTDEELQKIASQQGPDLSKYSDEQLMQIAAQKSTDKPTDLYVAGTKAALGPISGARPFIAGVGGGVGAAAAELDNANLGLVERIKALPKAFQSGFAQAKQGAIAEEADLAERRPILNLASDVGAAALSIPVATAAKGASLGMRLGQAVGGGAGIGAAQALGRAETGEEAAKEIGIGGATGLGGQLVAEALPFVVKAGKKALTKASSALTGVTEKTIETYAKNADEVAKLAKESGGNITEAADLVRKEITAEIKNAKDSLGKQIGDALSNPKYDRIKFKGSVILDDLLQAKAAAQKNLARGNFRPDEIAGLDEIIEATKKSIGPDGKISARDLFNLKQELQEAASPIYLKKGQIFSRGDLAEKASASAGSKAADMINSIPEVGASNKSLSRLHEINGNLNRNLIAAETPEAAILAAGSGSNPRNLKVLREFDKITGGSAAQKAENLAAMRSFGSYGAETALPVDNTGKSMLRAGLGLLAGAGAATGGLSIPVAAGVAATTSPWTTKLAIDSARMTKKIADVTRATTLGKIGAQSLKPLAVEGALQRRQNELKGQ